MLNGITDKKLQIKLQIASIKKTGIFLLFSKRGGVSPNLKGLYQETVIFCVPKRGVLSKTLPEA